MFVFQEQKTFSLTVQQNVLLVSLQNAVYWKSIFKKKAREKPSFFVIQLGKYKTHFVYVWDLMHCILAQCVHKCSLTTVISGRLLEADQSSKLILELPKDVCFFFQKSTFKRDAVVRSSDNT